MQLSQNSWPQFPDFCWPMQLICPPPFQLPLCEMYMYQSPRCPTCKGCLLKIQFILTSPVSMKIIYSYLGVKMIYSCLDLIVFAVNELVTKYKLHEAGSAKRRHFSDEGQGLSDAITAASDEGKQRDTERDLHCLDGLFC